MLWRCLLATTLGLIWYLLDYGQFLIQVSICLLCFLAVDRAACSRSDGSAQTESSAEDAQPQENDHIVGRDETDSAAKVETTVNRLLYPNVWKSLQQLFKCAYAQLILPWYPAPETRDKQPLYTALLGEFDLIADQIICKARNFDLSVSSVGCIHIFTHHLRCAKQSEGSPPFNCKAEEMEFLRKCSDTLIRNLFPQHLWEARVYRCALQEILATKVLALVTLLSDPHILNRLVICQLDQVPCESLLEERCDSDREDTSTSVDAEIIEVPKEEVEKSPSEEIKAKKKGSTVKEKFSKIFKPKRGKSKKIKKNGKEQMPKVSLLRRPAVIQTDGASSCDDSNYDSEDSDVGSCTSSLPEDMMEFKLSFQMWLAGKWMVTVTNVDRKEETCFTVHVEESSNPDNLHWDVKKTQSEIVEFDHHCEDVSYLPSISILLENTETNLTEDYKKEAVAAFEHYLQVLVTNVELGHSQLVFKFLCPLHKLLREEEQVGGVWVLLGGIASFLTPGQEDDEPNHLKAEEKPDEHADICSVSERTPHHDSEELDSAQSVCVDTLQRQHKETERDLLVTDMEYSPSSDQTYYYSGENQCTVFPDRPFEDSDQVHSSGSESVGENLANFAARTKVIPKKQPAVFSSFDSDDESTGQYVTDGISDCHFNFSESLNKKQHLARKKSPGSDKLKGKEKLSNNKEETRSLPQVQKKMPNTPNWGQLDVSTVVFDLLKEISGNSRILKIFKTALKPFMPLVKKKVNTFLKMMNPSEAQMATRIDQLRELLWPEGVVSQEPPQGSENKTETKEKAMHLMSSKLAGFPLLSKTDGEIMFKTLQDAEGNKKLVYKLLSYLLKEFLPGETALNGMSKLNGWDAV